MTDRLLRTEEVIEICGVSRAAIYVLMGKGKFPKPRQIGPRSNRWLESEILEWMTCLPRAGDREDMKAA